MPEAVIVATARSPIGRAMKGSLKDMRPDDLSAQVLTDLMSKVPQITPDHIDDLITVSYTHLTLPTSDLV